MSEDVDWLKVYEWHAKYGKDGDPKSRDANPHLPPWLKGRAVTPTLKETLDRQADVMKALRESGD